MSLSEHKVFKFVVLSVVAILSLLVLAALVIYFISWSCDANKSNDTNYTGSRVTPNLRLIIAITRHGNRSPLFTYPTYPYPINDTQFWPHGPSQLTTKGRNQLYRLGKQFRTLYNMFLSDKYNPNDFKASSTETDRTLMSAQAFLAGLFPPKGFQVWNEDLLWQPVPIYYSDRDHTEYVGAEGAKLCPRIKELKIDFYSRYKKENEANLTAITEHIRPYTEPEIDDVFKLWDSLRSADREGLALPTWAGKIYPEPLASLIDKFEIAMSTGSDEMIRIYEGHLYQEIVGVMEAKAKDSLTPDRKMYLYSGHDLTVRVISTILGSRLGLVNTGSALVLELHRFPESTKYFVQVAYIDGGSEDLEPFSVAIPGCGVPCPLDVLMGMTSKYYNVTDIQKECQPISKT